MRADEIIMETAAQPFQQILNPSQQAAEATILFHAQTTSTDNNNNEDNMRRACRSRNIRKRITDGLETCMDCNRSFQSYDIINCRQKDCTIKISKICKNRSWKCGMYFVCC